MFNGPLLKTVVAFTVADLFSVSSDIHAGDSTAGILNDSLTSISLLIDSDGAQIDVSFP